MKKKSIIIIISTLIILASLLSSCSGSFSFPSGSESASPSESSSDESKIKELEAQINALMQSHQLSETQRQKEIAELTAELEKLKNNASKPTDDTPVSGTEQKPEETEPTDSFKYTLDSGRAIITAITPVGESVTIPATIDGYKVVSIGSEALSSNTVKNVIISDGIEKLDWFALRNCQALSSVTIPDSVTSIGYGAFDNTAKALTIICSRDSFAHKYAQSYGFTYDIS